MNPHVRQLVGLLFCRQVVWSVGLSVGQSVIKRAGFTFQGSYGSTCYILNLNLHLVSCGGRRHPQQGSDQGSSSQPVLTTRIYSRIFIWLNNNHQQQNYNTVLIIIILYILIMIINKYSHNHPLLHDHQSIPVIDFPLLCVSLGHGGQEIEADP